MITQEQWQDVEEKLKSFYNIVCLNCDGYKLELCLQRTSQMENHIGFYVNGVFKGKWILEDCEERRRFFRPVTRKVFPLATRQRVKKAYGKREYAKQAEQWEKSSTYYLSHWKSFKRLKSHLIKHNNKIELVEKKS